MLKWNEETQQCSVEVSNSVCDTSCHLSELRIERQIQMSIDEQINQKKHMIDKHIFSSLFIWFFIQLLPISYWCRYNVIKTNFIVCLY